MSRYALEHTDTTGQTHRWTCSPPSAHWVARWLARDAGRPVTVLTDAPGGWMPITVWYPSGEPDPPLPRGGDDAPETALSATESQDPGHLTGDGYTPDPDDDHGDVECAVYNKPIIDHVTL